MLDDWQEVFALALIQLGFSARTPTTTAELDQALALLQQQKPLVRLYSTDRISDMSSGDIWIGQIWGADLYHDPAGERRTSPTTSPRKAASRAPTRSRSSRAPKHPIAAHLFINHLLDAQVSADEHELHRLHGSECRGQGVHRRRRSWRPRGQPGPGDRRQAPGAARPRPGGPGRVPVSAGRPSAAAADRPVGTSAAELRASRAPRCCPASPGSSCSSSSRWRSSSSSAWASVTRSTGSSSTV